MSGLRKVKQIYLNNYVETYFTDIQFTAPPGNGAKLCEAVDRRIVDIETFKRLSKNFYLDVIFNVWRTEATNKYGTLTDDQCYNEMKKDARQYFNFKFDTATMFSLFQQSQSFLGLSKFLEAKRRFIAFYRSTMEGKTDLENVEDYKSLRKEKDMIKRNKLQPSAGLTEAKKAELDKITSEIAKRRISVGPETPRKDTPREGKNILNYVYNAKTGFLDSITTGDKEKCIEKLWLEVKGLRLIWTTMQYDPNEPYLHLMYAFIFVYNAYTQKEQIALPIINYAFVWDKANKLYLINSISPDGIYLKNELNYLTSKGLANEYANLKATFSDATFTNRHKEHFYNVFMADAGRTFVAPVSLPAPEPPKSQPKIYEPSSADKKLDADLKANKITDISELKKYQDYLENKIIEAEEQKRESKQKYYEELLYKLNDILMSRIEDETRINPTNPELPQKPVTPKRTPDQITSTTERIDILRDEQRDINELFEKLKKIIEYCADPELRSGDVLYMMKRFKAELRGNVENIRGQLPESKERLYILDKYASLSANIGIIEKRYTDLKPGENFVNDQIRKIYKTRPFSHIGSIAFSPLRTPGKTPISISPSRPDTVLTPEPASKRVLFGDYKFTMIDFYNTYLKPIYKDEWVRFLDKIKLVTENQGNYSLDTHANGVDQLWDKYLQIIWNTSSEKDQKAIRDFSLAPSNIKNVRYTSMVQFIDTMNRVLQKPEDERRSAFISELINPRDGMPVDFYYLITSSMSTLTSLKKQDNYLNENQIALIPEQVWYLFGQINKANQFLIHKTKLDEFSLPNLEFEYIIEKQLPAPIRNRFIEILDYHHVNKQGENVKTQFSYDVALGPPVANRQILQERGLIVRPPTDVRTLIPRELQILESPMSQQSQESRPPQLLLEYQPMLENERALVKMSETYEFLDDRMISRNQEDVMVIRSTEDDDDDIPDTGREVDLPQTYTVNIDLTQAQEQQQRSRFETLSEEQHETVKKYKNVRGIQPLLKNTMRIWINEKFYVDIHLDS